MNYGSCLCGAIKYSVAGDLKWSCHCHCTMCRKNSGSAVASFVSFELRDFEVIKGVISTYESSPGSVRSFCSQCGTPLIFCSNRFPEEVHIFLGTLANPENFPAQFQVFCASQLPWLSIDENVPKFDTLPMK